MVVSLFMDMQISDKDVVGTGAPLQETNFGLTDSQSLLVRRRLSTTLVSATILVTRLNS